MAVVLILLSLIAMGVTKNGYGAVTDIVYKKAMMYDDEMLSRWSFLETAQQSKAESVELKLIENTPVTLFVLDINEDSSYFFNQGYARYFGMQVVKRKSH